MLISRASGEAGLECHVVFSAVLDERGCAFPKGWKCIQLPAGGYAMKTLRLLVIALVALVPSLGMTDDTLAAFKGGIGADSVSSPVTTNIVRGVQPPAQLWAIADLRAEVKVDGHIKVDGRGLVFAGGNTIGTALVLTPAGGTATLEVFATLICENVAPFVERNTNPVPLAADGDFRIDDVLSPWPPASCNTPVLLIRNAGNRTWFAAGIQKFDGND
jgi:hypothetical protein